MKPLPPPQHRAPVQAASALVEQSDPTESSRAWRLVLDELGERLARLRGCAVNESALLDLPDTQWIPPIGIGELPADLAPRAAALLQEMEALRPKLQRRREETVQQLRAVDAVPRETGWTSVYLDSVG